MSTDCCLQCCSSTDLRDTQKRIAEILKTREKKIKHSKNCSQISSRSSSRCSRQSKKGKKTVAYNFNPQTGKSMGRRSQSLISLKDEFSTTTCVDSINKKYQQRYNFDSLCSHAGQSEPGNSEDYEDDDDKNISVSTSLSHVTYSKGHDVDTRAKQYQKLSNSVKRLYSILDQVHASIHVPLCNKERSRSQSMRMLEKKPIPSSYEKDCIPKLASYVDSLTKNVQKRVASLVSHRREEKTCLDNSRNDNTVLKQRLNNSLTIQRNLEGELKELNKEKKLLDLENKNLAIKMVPFLNDNKKNASQNKNESGTAQQREELSYYKALLVNDEDAKNNNFTVDSENLVKKSIYNPKSATAAAAATKGVSKRSPLYHHRCSRRSSVTGITTSGGEYEDDQDVGVVSQSVSESNLTDYSTTVEESKTEEIVVSRRKQKCKSRDELDSIASYVKWKNMDFERLHGKLHKNFDELRHLKETVNWMSKEKTEILADLEDLVDSYRELEMQRDNYESILKMILKEKNSAESNIADLLDSLLVHLNNANNQKHFHHQHDCSSCSAGGNCSSSHRCSSKSFLESALHVLQAQNISVREDMTRLRETLQNTTGQNTLLQANNNSLMEKVNDLQRQVESKAQQVGQNEKELKEKSEQWDKLYNTISSAKDELENRLKEKEKEIASLNLKNVTEASEKALKDQTEKILELKDANAKLEKELIEFRTNNEKLSQDVKLLKSSMREQKGKWNDRINSTNNALQKSNDQCNWLQDQIENLKTQLVDAHEKIKSHEKDKSMLAHKVLVSDEERKTLDRNIHEIRTVMQADKLYQQALTERNEVLQLEVNRLRTEKLNDDCKNDTNCVKPSETSTSGGEHKSGGPSLVKKGEDVGDGSGEMKNNHNRNQNVVKTSVVTVKSSRPTKTVQAPSSRRPREKNCSRSSGGVTFSRQSQRPSTAKTVPTVRHSKCSVCRPITENEAITTGPAYHAAARRLSHSLSINNSRRGASQEYAANSSTVPVRAASSSGRHSTQKMPATAGGRAVASAQEMSVNEPKNPNPHTGIYRDITPLSRKHRRHHVSRSRKHQYYSDLPRATVSLHNNPAVVCYRSR